MDKGKEVTKILQDERPVDEVEPFLKVAGLPAAIFNYVSSICLHMFDSNSYSSTTRSVF